MGSVSEKVYSPEDNLPVLKKFLFSAGEMPKHFKAPILLNGLPPLMHDDLNMAKLALCNELEDFETFYRNTPTATCNNPVFGCLNYEEWKLFHQKHFTHHFKQFGLL